MRSVTLLGMSVRRVSWLLAAFLAAGCGGDGKDKPVSLVDRCVQMTVELYEKHDLPFTKKASERPAICRKMLEEGEITTHAELVILMRQADKELAELDK